MSGMSIRMRDGIVAAAVVAALGFGAGQALAGPVDAPERQECNPTACDAMCKGRHGPFASGFCDPDLGCLCAI